MNTDTKSRISKYEIIIGSNRPNGNSEQAGHYICDLLAKHDIDGSLMCLREFEIAPCGGCGECNTREVPCTLKDDMPSLIDRLTLADGIIYIAPVHGYGLAHPMQIFIERAGVGYLRFKRPLANKVAGCVITGRRYGHVSVFNQITNNILLNRMILVGSGYPTVLFGGTPGRAMQDQEGLQSVQSLVNRMAGMTNLLNQFSPADISTHLTPKTSNERTLSGATVQ